MTSFLIDQEMSAPYVYVVSGKAIQDVTSLIGEEYTLGGLTSVVLRQPWIGRHSILELRGLGREVWQGIDPKKYIDELRNEWDAR
jgi:hypothetical protein